VALAHDAPVHVLDHVLRGLRLEKPNVEHSSSFSRE
jgi:hypothetical protein